jgi:hypothetical protein
MTKKRSYKKKSQKKIAGISLSNLGFSGWIIIFLSIAILTFIGSMVFNKSRAYRSEPAISPVTIQLLNGCGVNGACEDLASALLPGKDGLLYDIIEKADAEFFGFDKTLVIDRSDGQAGEISDNARAIAERMNIDDKNILNIKLADNLLDIDVTIIAGSDYKEIVEKLKSAKEEKL